VASRHEGVDSKMTRRLVVALLLASLIAVSAPSAKAADLLLVKVSGAQAELDASGNVLVPLRARCRPPLDAFELDVSVRQGATFGSVVLLGTEFPPCDGRWHQITVSVAPDAGSFVSGVATVDASLSAFHPVEGDLIVFDTVTVRL
jgi:hypothetical protein